MGSDNSDYSALPRPGTRTASCRGGGAGPTGCVAGRLGCRASQLGAMQSGNATARNFFFAGTLTSPHKL